MNLRPLAFPSSPVRTLIVLAASTLLLGGCGIDDTKIESVSLGELSTAMANRDKDSKALLLVDARAPQDFATGHLPGAKNILLSDLPEQRGRDKRLEVFDRIIVYGKDPASPTARGLVKRMLALDYDDVKLYPGGIEEWTGSGRTLEMPEPAKPATDAAKKSAAGVAPQPTKPASPK